LCLASDGPVLVPATLLGRTAMVEVKIEAGLLMALALDDLDHALLPRLGHRHTVSPAALEAQPDRHLRLAPRRPC
jgi:hypothetical protein